MTNPSRFIVLEGLDGVGKSTLANKLAEQLGAQFMSTPGDRFKAIRSPVMEAFGEDQLAKALFYAATVSSEGRKARSIVDQDRSVVMDRYWASTLAYAKARGVSANIDALESDLIAADITVLITLDENTRLKRLQQRGMTAEDLETINAEFKQAVMRELELRSDITVDVSTLDPAVAATKIASAINEYFGRMTPVKRAPL